MAAIIRERDGSVTKYAWPGGYTVYYLANDGEPFCADCVQNESGIHEGGDADGWRIDGNNINYEDNDLFCCNCDAPIPASYGTV